MTAQLQPIYVEQGATFFMGFVWAFESVPPTDPPTAGVPHNLTGCIARMQIRKSQQTPALVTVSSDGANPGIILGGSTGRVDIKITDEQTDLLVHKGSLYDIEIQMGNGDVHRLFQGPVTVDPNITQIDPSPVLIE